MEENKVTTEEIKNETVETAKKVTDTIKKEANEAKGLVSTMLKDPFGKIKEIVDDKENKNLKIAIIFVVIWTVVVLIKALAAKYWSFNILFKNILSVLKTIIAPALSILVLSAIVYFMNKKEKKSLMNIITPITIAQTPTIIASIVSLFTLLSINAYKITTPIASLCNTVTIILTYFTIKEIYKEEQNSKFLKTFIIIEAIYYLAYVIISFLGIYI